MKIIGHRGAAGLAPENTLASIQKALDNKVDGIEFDVRVTEKGIPILQHEVIIHQTSQASLAEALNLVGSKTTAYIEIKPGEPIEPIIKILTNCKTNFWVGSKNQKLLLAIHRALPEAQLFVIDPWSGIRARFRSRQVGTKTVWMNQRWLWWGFIRGFKKSDWKLFAYTVNDPKKAKRWESYGLTGVITDCPDRFRD